MKNKRLLLITALSVSFMCSCAQQNNDRVVKLTFYQDEGNQTDVMKFVVGKTTQAEVDSFRDNISINPRRGYDTAWRKVDVKNITDNYVVNMKYSLHNYTITYVYGDDVLGTATYNVKSKTIDEPYFEGEPGYCYVTEPYNFRNRAEDFIVHTTKEEAQFSVTFKKSIDDDNPMVAYYSVSNPRVTTPSGIKGYDMIWSDGTTEIKGGDDLYLSGSFQNYVFIGSKTPKTYTLTYNPNGGTMSETTQTVTYDQPYTLHSVTGTTLEHVGWYDEKDVRIEENGIWNIDSDLELIARWGYNFEGNEVPSTFTNLNRTSLAITDDDASLGNKSLKVTITEGSGNYQLKFAKEALEEMFKDPNVVAVNFDAKSTEATNNFRSTHFEDGKVSAWTYENNSNGYGVSNDWKTFSFKREYLQGYEDFVSGAASNGTVLHIDNIRAVTHELNGFGFECGALDRQVYKDGGHQNAKPAPQQVFTYNADPSSVVKSVGISFEQHSEGMRSLKFSKESGYLSLYLSTDIVNSLNENSYFTFDIYTTIAVDSNPDSLKMVDGLSTGGAAKPFGTGSYQHPKNTWVTYSLTKDRMTQDGRFMQIMCGACDLYIDNIVIYR